MEQVTGLSCKCSTGSKLPYWGLYNWSLYRWRSSADLPQHAVPKILQHDQLNRNYLFQTISQIHLQGLFPETAYSG